MSDITFERVIRPPASAGKPTPVKPPRMIAPPTQLYPPQARRLGEQGVVDFEYTIDGSGHAQDIQQLYASAPQLAELIPAYLRSAQFRVPANWEQTGSANGRYTTEFRFALSPPQGCGAVSTAEPRIAGAWVIGVCDIRLPPAARESPAH